MRRTRSLTHALARSLRYPSTGLRPGPRRFLTFLSVLSLESAAATATGLTVSAVSPSTDVALVLGPAIMVVFIIFGGSYQDPATLPRAWRPLPRVSMIRRAFAGLSVNEMAGRDFGGCSGDAELERMGFAEQQGGSMAALAKICAVNYLLSYLILKRRAGMDTVRLEDPGEAPLAD